MDTRPTAVLQAYAHVGFQRLSHGPRRWDLADRKVLDNRRFKLHRITSNNATAVSFRAAHGPANNSIGNG